MPTKVKEYVLDPNTVAQNWKVCLFWLNQFGFNNARVIAQFPKGWLRALDDALLGVGDVAAARIIETIQAIREETILLVRTTGREYQSEQSWEANVIRENSLSPFDGIISDTIYNIDNLASLDECSQRNNRVFAAEAINCMVPRTSEALGTFASVLIRHSNALKFIDRYFDANKGEYRDAFETYIQIASEKNKESIEIFAESGRISVEHFESGLKRLPELILGDQELHIYLWENGAEAPEIDHARYILGEKAGLQFDSGLAAHPTDKTLAGCLSIEVQQQMWNHYSSEGGSIKLLPRSYKIDKSGLTFC